MMPPNFWKYHAAGNSYFVIDQSTPLDKSAIQRLCSPQVGIGSDGILVGRHLAPDRFALRIFNPDGTEAEKSGNGLRIFARSVWDRGLSSAPQITIETKGGPTTAWQTGTADEIAVNLGPVDVFPDSSDPQPGTFEQLLIDGQLLSITPVSTGNPHCVIFQSDTSPLECQRLGPQIETHARFRQRTNVQFVRVINRQKIALEIWERGAGYTLSSGSSASAAAAAARFHGYIDAQCKVQCPGGFLFVDLSDESGAILSGNVQKIAVGTFN